MYLMPSTFALTVIPGVAAIARWVGGEGATGSITGGRGDDQEVGGPVMLGCATADELDGGTAGDVLAAPECAVETVGRFDSAVSC